MKNRLMEMEDEAGHLILEATLGNKFSVNIARKIFLQRYPNQENVFNSALADWDVREEMEETND